MNEEIQRLEPQKVWTMFAKICSIPHGSHKEEKISKFIADFGRERGYETLVDEYGNVLIRRPASAGCESAPGLLLQSHMDMVCEKNADCSHDFENDPIQAYVDGEWVKARGTTLGADDGIGVAYQLAVLADEKLKCGPIECLFTVDEEVGLLGAHTLRNDWIKSEMLVNLDSEEQGEFCIGCAGGIGTFAEYNYHTEAAPAAYYAEVSIHGLIGGHSGAEIDKNRGNAIKIMARYAKSLRQAAGELYVAKIDGGNLHNAIPRECVMVVGVPMAKKEHVRIVANMLETDVQSELSQEERISIETSTTDTPKMVIDAESALNLIAGLDSCPHGVIAMSETLKGLVQTSTNLASVKMPSEGLILIETSQRSSVMKERDAIAEAVSIAFQLKGAAKTYHDEGYPGWEPNVNSRIKDIARDCYVSTLGEEPKIGAIHAGLECGLFREKYPELDMVSLGPTIIGNHSPAERVEIKTVDMTWRHLLAIIDTVSKLKCEGHAKESIVC